MEDINGKISILKSSNSETSNYLGGLLTNYIKEIDHYNNLEINRNLNPIDNIVFCNDLDKLETLRKGISKNITYIYFTNKFNEKLISKISKEAKIILVAEYSESEKNKVGSEYKNVCFSKLDFLDIKKNIISKKVKFIINLNDFDIGKDWVYETRHNFNIMLTKLNNFTVDELNSKTLECTKKIIECNETYNLFDRHIGKNTLRKLIKLIDKLNDYCYKNNIETNFKYNNTNKYAIIEYNEEDNFKYTYITKYLDKIFTIINTHSLHDRYSKIYDNICEFLDNEFVKYNYCDFKNNKCIAQRDKDMSEFTLSEENGCCYIPETKVQCNKLDSGKCTIKCSACKLIVCKYLKKYGIEYYVHDSLELNSFLSTIQKPVLVWNFFTPKQVIISKLLKRKIIKHQKNRE